MIVHYFFHDDQNRVCGFGTIEGQLWDTHQASLWDVRKLKMVPIFDLAQLDMLREQEPHNVMIDEAYQLQPLPPEQRRQAPEIIVLADSQMETMIALQKETLEAIRQMPAAMTKAMIEGMK